MRDRFVGEWIEDDAPTREPSVTDLTVALMASSSSPVLLQEADDDALRLQLLLSPSGSPPREPSSRMFLFDRASRRYLGIAELNALAVCMTTPSPGSLFVCHMDARLPSEVCADLGYDHDSMVGPRVCAFEHEGFPAPLKYLSFRRSWMGSFSRGRPPPLQCDGTEVGVRQLFLWYDDGSLRHLDSGLWVNVGPEDHLRVVLGEVATSFWADLPPV